LTLFSALCALSGDGYNPPNALESRCEFTSTLFDTAAVMASTNKAVEAAQCWRPNAAAQLLPEAGAERTL
jgi:hypothetical protein